MTRSARFNIAQLGPGPEIAEQAHALVEAGVPIFPVFGVHERVQDITSREIESRWVCGCGREGAEDGHKPGKHPAWAHGHLDAVLMDDIVIAHNFLTRGHNLAYRTGNGLAVIDVDEKNDGLATLDDWQQWTGFSLPETLTCRTGGGGLHLLYRYEVETVRDVATRPGVLPGIDVKGAGGYCLANGSRHISGRLYSWVDRAVPVARATGRLLDWLHGPGSGGGGGGGKPSGYSFTQGAVAGQRDAFFNDLAFRSRREGLDWDEAYRRQRSAWEATEQPAGDIFEWRHALAKLERVWSTVQPDDQVGASREALGRWNTARAGRRRTGSGPAIVGRERRLGL